MKTTIELPDELAREARELALEQRTTLKDLVVEGLRSEVERRRESIEHVDFVFPTYGGGWLRDDLTLSEAIIEAYGDRA